MAKRSEHDPRTCEKHDACISARVKAQLLKIEDRSRAVPTHPDQTVPVRAHWRRQPNHLNKMPKTKAILQAAIMKMIKANQS